MRVPVAVAVALCYGLAMVAILAYRRFRPLWLLAAFAAGAVAFPITLLLVAPIQLLLASLFGWDMGAYSTNLVIGLIGAVIAAGVNEIFKLAAALLVLSWGGKERDALAFGAAAGAGFAAVGAYEVIGLALMARTLPLAASGSLATPFVQQFAFVAVNAASTALAAYGVSRHRLGIYLLAAILYETLYAVLGLLFSLQLYTILAWTLLGVAVGLLLLGYTFVLSLRATGFDRPAPTS